MSATADIRIRDYQPVDRAATYDICMRTGDYGGDGEPFFRDDPDALGRIYVEPYLRFEPELAVVLEDSEGVCGYALAARDTRAFYQRYETELRPELVAEFPDPEGESANWDRVRETYHCYHHPDYYYPEDYDQYPAHLHIDLLPRTQGQGWGRHMMEHLLDRLRRLGVAGVHLGMSGVNHRAEQFYLKLGFEELAREGTGTDESVYLGLKFRDLAVEGK